MVMLMVMAMAMAMVMAMVMVMVMAMVSHPEGCGQVERSCTTTSHCSHHSDQHGL